MLLDDVIAFFFFGLFMRNEWAMYAP